MIQKSTYQKDTETIGGILRAQRILRGFTQQQAAQALGISPQQFQKYETGANRISAATLFVLSRVWNIPIQSFFPETIPDKSMHLHTIHTNDLTIIRNLHQLQDPLRTMMTTLISHMAKHG